MKAPAVPAQMKRIVVVGSSGSGKSTLAESLADLLGCKHIEIDAHNFVAGWQTRPQSELHDRIERETHGECWVACGNYGTVRDVTWGRADTLVFLDYPLGLVLWRLTRRSLTRAITRENLWGSGNRENFFVHLQWNKNSLYFWAITNHERRRREYPQLITLPEYAHLRYVHLTGPRIARMWLDAVRAEHRAGPGSV